MKFIEKLKLIRRAHKYKNKDDKGGIAYLLHAIEKGQTAMDIGAHKAGYTYWMVKKLGAGGKVYAIEPQSNLYEYIKKTKTIFNWKNVKVDRLALSDSQGMVKLFIPDNKVRKNSSPGATIVENKFDQHTGLTEDVEAETLDAYCEKYNIRPDFIKIDVEGNELRVFQGGINTLNKYTPKILVEIEARHVGQEKVLETFKFMELLGYNGHCIHGMKRIPLKSFSFDKHQNTDDKRNYCNNFTFEKPLSAQKN